jgi:thioredoxin 1
MTAKKVSDSQFDAEVLNSSGPVLVDFWAEWCGPCKQLGPVIDEIAGERSDLKVTKVNIDESPEAPQKYGVRGIPTMMIFKDGKVIGTKVGALPKSKVIEWINSVVAA